MKSPTSCTTTSEGIWTDHTWVNPGNATALDASYASSTGYALGDRSYVLKAKGFDFSAIPAGSTIDGVIVSVWCMDVNDVSCDLMQLLDTGGAKVGTNQCSVPVAVDTGVIGDITKGGAADLWGNALTRAWVQDADFGVAVGFVAGANDSEVYVDHIEMTVYYTAGVSGMGAKAVSVGYFGRTQI